MSPLVVFPGALLNSAVTEVVPARSVLHVMSELSLIPIYIYYYLFSLLLFFISFLSLLIPVTIGVEISTVSLLLVITPVAFVPIAA